MQQIRATGKRWERMESIIFCAYASRLAFPEAILPLFSAFSSSAIRLSCRLPSTNARNERIRASKIPIMAKMYAQRTEQAPRVYLSVFSPHIRFTSSESQPSGKIRQPSTRQAAERERERKKKKKKMELT